MRLRAVLLSAILLALTPFATAYAQRGGDDRWEQLGRQTVGLGVDRDVIKISDSEDFYRNRAFRQLRFRAEGNDVNMMSLTLVYLNGHREELRIGKMIRRDGELVVDLPGERSFLRAIEMQYSANPSISFGSGGLKLQQATVTVYGERARRGPPPDRFVGRGWELLGTQTVGFRVERDAVRINQSEDWYRNRRFRTIHFVADGNDVHMMNVRVVYMNGWGEDYRVDRLIKDGSDLPLDLRGDRSFIKVVEMTYRARPNFDGKAIVKIYGEPVRR